MKTIFEKGDVWLVRVDVPVVTHLDEEEARVRRLSGQEDHEEERQTGYLDLGQYLPLRIILPDTYREGSTFLEDNEGKPFSLYISLDEFLAEYLAYIERHPDRFGIDTYSDEAVDCFREEYRDVLSP